MFGINKKKKAPGNMVWMIKHKTSGLYVGVCKKDLVHLKDPTNCFRFSDINAAGIFLYWLIQREELKQGEHEVIYALVESKDVSK